MSVTPPRSGPSVVVVLVVASVVLLALAAVIVALTLNLTNSASRSPQKDDDEPEVTELVLDATWADGSTLDDDELATVEDIVTTRLEGAEIDGFDLSVDDDQIHVAFDDEDDVDAAADLLDVTFAADFRPVLDVGMCSSDNDYTDYGPDEEVVFCDAEGTALQLGPSEVSGDTIIGASTYARDDGTWGVTIIFDPTGAADLADLTQRLSLEEGVTNRLAITLDGQVIESPSVSEAIMNGEVSITGTLDEEYAEALATQLRFAGKGLELRVE